ncbi:hypothetical protein [Roseomonas xinghualingensis]|uniref:hypothetical protein n=1 Tax=Roseomonas xinghualingensis TaxID=2986475 RepID=UPI0021F173AC|nr:hypothetical protein [Roseomonas sp. SXEYE001]MCV4208391.1 hypothetical protein [Roseomonas sp. SXEYE001]
MSDLPLPTTLGTSLGQLRRHPLVRGLRVVCYAVLGFALTFVELVAELLASFLLLGGALWWITLKVINSLSVEAEVQDILRYFPTRVAFGEYWVTPTDLIRQGLLLLAVIAACHTLNRLIDRKL